MDPYAWHDQGTIIFQYHPTVKFSPIILLSVIHLPTLWAKPADAPPDDLKDIQDEIVKKIEAIKPTSSKSTNGDEEVKGYVVRTMDDLPLLVAYQSGGNRDLPGTTPNKGQKLNPQDGNVKKYQDFLKGKHASTLNGAGIDTSMKFQDYTVCFDGFAAKLTKNAEVEELRGLESLRSQNQRSFPWIQSQLKISLA
jgi:hypothetical protein